MDWKNCAVKITKTSQQTKNFFRTDSLLLLGGFVSSFLKYKKVSDLVAKKFHFPKCKKHFKSAFFHFSSSESSFLKYKKFFRVFVSWNIRNCCRVSVSWNIRKPFCSENIKNFHFRNIRKYKIFFYFSSLGLRLQSFAKYIWNC